MTVGGKTKIGYGSGSVSVETWMRLSFPKVYINSKCTCHEIQVLLESLFWLSEDEA